MKPTCKANSECNWGHYRHYADVLVILTPNGEPTPICNGTADEWEARYPEEIARFEKLPE